MWQVVAGACDGVSKCELERGKLATVSVLQSEARTASQLDSSGRHPVGGLQVDHATATDSGWRRHSEVANLCGHAAQQARQTQAAVCVAPPSI
jgi:hypothetical protein